MVPYLPEDEPEGTIIYDTGMRQVIRHGDKITKLSLVPDGMKRGPNEAAAMRFIQENTTIPVPRVYSTTQRSITMEYIEGTNLMEAWDGLSDTDRAAISAQLRDHVNQLRAIKGSRIGAFDGGPAVDARTFTNEGGPFATQAEWNDFLLSDLFPRWPGAAPVRSIVRSQLRADYEVVFTHGDLKPANVLVRDGRVVAVIDWEYAGFYPEYLDLVKALRGSSWSCGYYSALLDVFPRRYDAEYIVDQFINRISRNSIG